MEILKQTHLEKIFAVYSKVDLIEKPAWFDEFYKKYNPSSNGYHVTLKQSCYVKEESLALIKRKLTNLFASTPVPNHEITLNFNNLILDKGTNEFKTIMINAEHEPSIHKLQKDIIASLLGHRDYVYTESQAWEEDFKPHITLVSDASEDDYIAALKELKQPCACKGIIRNISLIIVEKMIPEEADKPENQIIYSL